MNGAPSSPGCARGNSAGAERESPGDVPGDSAVAQNSPATPSTVRPERAGVMKRQMIIKRKTEPVEFAVVLHESALRRAVGTRRMMVNQLRHLADESTRPNITVRVLPFAAGIPMGLLPGTFVILDFGQDGKGRRREPSVVYLESVLTGKIYLEREHDVDRYRSVWAAFHNASLNAAESRVLIRKIAKEVL
ncbi:DUF5753 domain-containing protein [Nocardia farcinica]